MIENLPELSDEQRCAFDHIVRAVETRNCEHITLGGFAGTGKSVLLSYLANHFQDANPLIGAYVGKAVDNLRRKGLVSATTLHQMIYDAKYAPSTRTWIYTPKISLDSNIVLVDEASMVPKDIHDLFMSYGVFVIYIGDHGQLPPIGDNDFSLMSNPDLKLETIHRQAQDSKIIQFSQFVRKGHKPNPPKVVGEVSIHHRHDFWSRCNDETIDQIIVGYNKTRVAVNKQVRQSRYRIHPDEPVFAGEKVICLRNNRDSGVFNGMMFRVLQADTSDDYIWVLDLEDDLGNIFEGVQCLARQFNQEKTVDLSIQQIRNQINLFDYGYGITGHKSQGSEYGKVLVLEELFPRQTDDLHARWRYTVITRAKTELEYCA